jgi:flagellar biosynthesis protein FliP
MKAARRSRGGVLRVVLAVLASLAPLAAWAQAGGLPALTSTPGAAGSQTFTLSVQTLLTLTALTFIPAALLMMTSFTGSSLSCRCSGTRSGRKPRRPIRYCSVWRFS